jgi:excisionase family DNA binding protein
MPKITVPTGSGSRIQIPAKYEQLKQNEKGELERIGVSVEEAAVMLSLCTRSVWVLVKEGKIRHVKFGTRCIVSVQSLREYVDGKRESIARSEHDDES